MRIIYRGGDDRNRTGVTGFADPRLNHSATSPKPSRATKAALRAEDGARTRDLNLGKVALYQLSYFRVSGIVTRHNWLTQGQRPVDPNPPSPRSDPGSSSTAIHS